MEEVDRVRILFPEDRDQHIGAGHFLLAGRLDVQDRTLDDALKAQRRLRIDFLAAGHGGRVRADELGQRLAQLVDVGGAGAQHFGRGGIVQQRQQQMLDRYKFVPFLARLHERHVQADFKFLGDHLRFLHDAL